MRLPRALLPYINEELGSEIVEPGETPPREPGDFGLSTRNAPGPASGTNVLINDPAGDPFGATQSENSLAAHGQRLVAGWNESFDPGEPASYSGFGYSTDGGRTWTDGGTLPHRISTDFTVGDPYLTVDRDGNFYFASLYSSDGEVLGVSVSRGRFRGNSFAFGPPVYAGVSKNDAGLDKEWIVADPETGELYLAYVRFFDSGANQIELVRSFDHGRSWSAPLVLTDSTREAVQGPRPAVGPNHEVYVVYRVVDLSDFSAHMRIRKSTRHGRVFAPEVNVGERKGENGIFPNVFSGPPGFNRPIGVELPSIAVDRSAGRARGSVYVSWPEAVDFFDDPLGGDGERVEIEGNNTPAVATPFTLGTALAGAFESGSDADWYSFPGTAGQTVEFYLTPAPGFETEGFLRLYCRDGQAADRLAFSYIGGGQAFIAFTLPADGTYQLRALPINPGAIVGGYSIFTGLHVPQALDAARDSRDVMLARSCDGVHWAPREIVNHDAARFDNAFSEVAVDGGGDVHLVWLDHRNDPLCGILTDVYSSRLNHGGERSAADQKVNDGPPTNWNLVPSALAPNMGDYIGLTADGSSVYANWSEGRLGSPDSWMASIGIERRHDSKDASERQGLASGIEGVAAPASVVFGVTNPVRLGTPIAMTLDVPRAMLAHLDVYAVTGQRVRTLLDGAVAPGAQRVTWDARRQDGARVEPGVYFAVFRTVDTRLTRRLVLVR